MIRRHNLRPRPFVAAVLLASAAATVVVGSAAAAPAARVRAASPGAVITADPAFAPPGARAWEVAYVSTDLAGNEIPVTGVVVAPDGPVPESGRPVVAWAHGTTGIADPCAPSANPHAAEQLPWIDELLAAGYVVAATDYAGLGTPGVHPWLVGESEGRSVLDGVRAARELPTGANTDVVVVGHSQGGHAAAFAGEIAAAYAPELTVRGVAPGAPVSDPRAFLKATASTPSQLGFLLLGALGYQAAYPELAALPLLPAHIAARADVARTACGPAVIAAFTDDAPVTRLGTDRTSRAAWTRRLRENALGRRPAGAPVLLWQGDDDALTPAEVNERYVARACARGDIVDDRRYAADHATVLDAAKADVLAFIAARFAGDPPTNTC